MASRKRGSQWHESVPPRGSGWELTPLLTAFADLEAGLFRFCSGFEG